VTKTDRHRNPAYDPLEETQENPALPPLKKPGRGRWVALAILLAFLLTLAVFLFG
jgi:hypothetical protein